ncbi:hypothetical protein LCGC14_1263390 [marine sediment metagenome]|uniref:Uncharacterized protein n=1 Tax=marine sediment metagenome TaxID=412755 RepID=A0A0F9L2D7_9ZZZZ
MVDSKNVKPTSMIPFLIESTTKDGKGFPIDVISVQRNANNTLYIERSQFDVEKGRYLPTEYYILQKTTKIKIGNIVRKLNDIRRDVSDLI